MLLHLGAATRAGKQQARLPALALPATLKSWKRDLLDVGRATRMPSLAAATVPHLAIKEIQGRPVIGQLNPITGKLVCKTPGEWRFWMHSAILPAPLWLRSTSPPPQVQLTCMTTHLLTCPLPICHEPRNSPLRTLHDDWQTPRQSHIASDVAHKLEGANLASVPLG